jgi:hypothetical protein
LVNRLVGPGEWFSMSGAASAIHPRDGRSGHVCLTAMGVNPSREAIERTRRLTRVANCAYSKGITQALDAPTARTTSW